MRETSRGNNSCVDIQGRTFCAFCVAITCANCVRKEMSDKDEFLNLRNGFTYKGSTCWKRKMRAVHMGEHGNRPRGNRKVMSGREVVATTVRALSGHP